MGMQIFVKSSNKLSAVTLKEGMTIGELNQIINKDFGLMLSPLYASSANAICTFRPLQTVNVMPMLCGGGNITEGDKLMSLESLTCKICRKCYERNAVKAKTCRKKMCGRTNQLRMKKTAKKK